MFFAAFLSSIVLTKADLFGCFRAATVRERFILLFSPAPPQADGLLRRRVKKYTKSADME
jgi:hypothetical protein